MRSQHDVTTKNLSIQHHLHNFYKSSDFPDFKTNFISWWYPPSLCHPLFLAPQWNQTPHEIRVLLVARRGICHILACLSFIQYKSLWMLCIVKVVVFLINKIIAHKLKDWKHNFLFTYSWYDIKTNFKDPKLLQSTSFEMNRSQIYRGVLEHERRR